MAASKKVLTLSVFGLGAIVIIPSAYALRVLANHAPGILANSPLASAQFTYANQVAIAVSLWSRTLEGARKLKEDVGYASYGLPSLSTSNYNWSSRSHMYSGSKGESAKPARPANRASAAGRFTKTKRSLSEDEVQLRDLGEERICYNARAEGGIVGEVTQDLRGIDVRRESAISRRNQ
ncbi:hypothetical protein LTR56_023582 [Elasticomyces elasticus]|nr:hypothetical protein LTR56_023582 [Elasticomyces elasticus]KAK3624107.1 hypothetical protein LTR22_024122 [Elasticomyces elasticus]KAK4908637.1 hypothetical protein LTR49_022501 [Elasticomyces elasticus]KAK5727771.1 hypothetical protein LTS12_027412 [Elasticomyces elasticus]